MIELGTGWDKEEDPRELITIPMSPTLLLTWYNRNFTFGANDYFGSQDNNCYAEGVTKDYPIDAGC